VQPGEGWRRASADIAPEMRRRSSGHGFVLQSLGDRGRFYEGKEFYVSHRMLVAALSPEKKYCETLRKLIADKG